MSVSLPRLTPDNYEEHREWHEYYERVYREPVTTPVDLNSFTWFYDFCPWKPTVWGSGWSDEPDNLPWKYSIDRWLRVCSPEYALAQIGFFVSRPLQPKETFHDGERVEIIRVGDLEFGVAWFYLVTGSGIFIHLPNPLTYIVERKKTSFEDVGIAHYLKNTSSNALILHIKGRRELVLSRPWQLGLCGACVRGLHYSTGLNTITPIHCKDHHALYWITFALLAAIILKNNTLLSPLLLLSITPFFVKYRPTHSTFHTP